MFRKIKIMWCSIFATVDDQGAPQIRCISAIHFEDKSLTFFTARGKAFCDELLSDGRVQILAYTRFKEMIRLSGKAVACAQEQQEEKINQIFEEQPYLANVYPGDTRKIGIVFEIKEFTAEYFNLGVKPIFRETYMVGQEIDKKGYHITESCIGCGTCLRSCPQKCIEEGQPYSDPTGTCLHCGACYENCPVKAVEKL